jgi:hypothetical protein
MDSIWGAWESVKEGLSGAVSTVGGWLSGAGNWIGDQLESAGNFFSGNGWNTKEGVMNSLKDKLQNGVQLSDAEKRYLVEQTDNPAHRIMIKQKLGMAVTQQEWANAEGAFAAMGPTLEMVRGGNGAAESAVQLSPSQAAEFKAMMQALQSDMDQQLKAAWDEMVPRLMEDRESLYQWEGSGADPKLVELSRKTQALIGERLGISPAQMKESWCYAMSIWAALKAERANVEYSPVDFFVNHAEKLIPWGVNKGRTEINGADGYVRAQDIIAMSYKNESGKMTYNVSDPLMGSTEQRYAMLAEFLSTTTSNGIHFRASSGHSVALIRMPGERTWTVWDTAGSNAHGTTFDPSSSTIYRQSSLYTTYRSPQYFNYYTPKPIR